MSATEYGLSCIESYSQGIGDVTDNDISSCIYYVLHLVDTYYPYLDQLIDIDSGLSESWGYFFEISYTNIN